MAEATTAQRKLTDRYLASVKGARAPYDIRDTEVPGLRCRVMPSGECTFVLLARYRRDGNPTRRALGTYPVLSLAAARDKAIEWKRQLAAGVDPTADEERRRREEECKRQNSFAAVAEQFIAHIHRQKLRTAADMEHDLRKIFVAEWGGRSITDIGRMTLSALFAEPSIVVQVSSAFRTSLLSVECSIGPSAPTITDSSSIRAIG